jgi:hypothetical protein
MGSDQVAMVSFKCPRCGHKEKQPRAVRSVGHFCDKLKRKFTELRKEDEE